LNLQTKIPLEKQSDNLIDYHSNILLLGSCFVENIGKKFEYFKFQNLQNPLGIQFNSVVIERIITNTINKKVYLDNDVFFHNERWHCYDAHSNLNASSKEDLLHNLNHAIESTAKQLNNSTHIVITLGTAWVYKNIETDKVVANCHKVPQKQFKKELLSIEAILENLESIIDKIRHINPDISVIFTVSPVRHLKDGFVENQLSKAHLISAIHQFINQKLAINNQRSYYFPSYEIMMDELRDYRFYAEDMIHPNQTAISYIWEKFRNVWISNNAYEIMTEVEVIQKGMLHEPFNKDGKEYLDFKKNLELKQIQLKEKFSYMRFDLRKRFRS
jgi:lysophospholipase L1-like esterase